jgi:hypothetical protein
MQSAMSICEEVGDDEELSAAVEAEAAANEAAAVQAAAVPGADRCQQLCQQLCRDAHAMFAVVWP